MQFVYKWFVDLNNKRTSNGFGINPIQYSEILAYFTLIEVQPEDWEVEMISKLDSIALEIYAKEAERQNKKNNK